MIRFVPVLAVCALSLVACDTAPSREAQPAKQSQEAEPTGTIARTRAGEAIPQVSVADPAGNTLVLHELGEPALVNLWATWCAPCKVEMPMLDRLADELKGEVRILTISQDVRDPEQVVPAYFAKEGFRNLEPWLDPRSDLAMELADGGVLPTTILYDAQGKELFRVTGDYEWDSEEAIAQIREALAQ